MSSGEPLQKTLDRYHGPNRKIYGLGGRGDWAEGQRGGGLKAGGDWALGRWKRPHNNERDLNRRPPMISHLAQPPEAGTVRPIAAL